MKFNFETYVYEFSPECLAIFESNRQKSCLSREIGGQLFARFCVDVIRVEAVTITKGRSKRSRFGFWPDRSAERADIKTMFEQGLHYIGDWHTHPESNPSPSFEDKTKMLEIYRQSTHELAYMLMVIVGLAAFPQGLFVGAVDTTAVTCL